MTPSSLPLATWQPYSEVLYPTGPACQWATFPSSLHFSHLLLNAALAVFKVLSCVFHRVCTLKYNNYISQGSPWSGPSITPGYREVVRRVRDTQTTSQQ